MNSSPVRMLSRPPGPKSASPWGRAPKGTHEWVSFPDPDEERTWLFDLTFLTSNWTCIFGNGCQGVLTGPAPELVHGCCSYGAHMTGGKDMKRVERAAAELTPEQWQFWKRGQPRQGKRMRIFTRSKTGDATTRLVDDACIFLNRPGFEGGPGCALHRAALDKGRQPLELKPDVCWQLPLRREDEVADDGHVTSVIRQWDRRDWGEGGHEFHWWCTESPDAFVGARRVYEELRPELVELVGQRIYRRLVRYIEARDAALGELEQHEAENGDTPGWRAVPLPHPAVRRKPG